MDAAAALPRVTRTARARARRRGLCHPVRKCVGVRACPHEHASAAARAKARRPGAGSGDGGAGAQVRFRLYARRRAAFMSASFLSRATFTRALLALQAQVMRALFRHWAAAAGLYRQR